MRAATAKQSREDRKDLVPPHRGLLHGCSDGSVSSSTQSCFLSSQKLASFGFMLDSCKQALSVRLSYGNDSVVNMTINNLQNYETCQDLGGAGGVCQQCLKFSRPPVIEPTYVEACPQTVHRQHLPFPSFLKYPRSHNFLIFRMPGDHFLTFILPHLLLGSLLDAKSGRLPSRSALGTWIALATAPSAAALAAAASASPSAPPSTPAVAGADQGSKHSLTIFFSLSLRSARFFASKVRFPSR